MWFGSVRDPDDSDDSLSWRAFGGRHIQTTTTPSGVQFRVERYWNGSEELTLAVADKEGLADSTKLVVTVTAVNDPPEIIGAPDTLASVGVRYTWRIVASDPDDSTLVYALSGPTWIRVDSIGTIQGVPTEAGRFHVVARVLDSHGAADSLVYLLSVTVLNSIADVEAGIPLDFVLQQNYPNPFNPSTIIGYGLPEQCHLRILIFNMIGQQVEELLHEDLDGGYYSISWCPTHLSSGTYFIVLQGNGLVTPGREVRLVKRAVLVK
jgi:hypothetical protein